MGLATQIKKISCWIITEGMIGTENQCRAVAQALDLKPDIFQIQLTQPWKTLTPWLGWEQDWSFAPRLTPPWPDLLITSGRKAVAASRYIKRMSGVKTLTLHIQDPKCPPQHFDLLAVPHHDTLRGENVIVTDGAPNLITPERLAEAGKDCPHLLCLPAPRIAVLIGGKSRTHSLTAEDMDRLISRLKTLEGSLMITASRRTGAENIQTLKAALQHHPSLFFWDNTPPNPYHAILAAADFILVTEDSVSMISDACSTGKPVYRIRMTGGSKRFDRFYHNLESLGVLRPFDGNLEPFTPEPLKDAYHIAQVVKKRLGIT